MTESLSPEERLRKYKEYLATLCRYRTPAEAADSQQSNLDHEELNNPIGQQHGKDVDDLKQAFSTLVANSKERNSSSNGKTVILQMRSRAIECAIQEIRHKKDSLESMYERKEITRDQYEYQLAELVSEGKALLHEKEKVTRELKSAF